MKIEETKAPNTYIVTAESAEELRYLQTLSGKQHPRYSRQDRQKQLNILVFFQKFVIYSALFLVLAVIGFIIYTCLPIFLEYLDN